MPFLTRGQSAVIRVFTVCRALGGELAYIIILAQNISVVVYLAQLLNVKQEHPVGHILGVCVVEIRSDLCRLVFVPVRFGADFRHTGLIFGICQNRFLLNRLYRAQFGRRKVRQKSGFGVIGVKAFPYMLAVRRVSAKPFHSACGSLGIKP